MTRSEEQLRVGTEKVEAGRARLRKYVVTEQQTVQVPVSHEEVRLEREPITDANRGEALAGGTITEEEHEVVLHAERPVVTTEAVPVERVRLGTETITDQQSVTGEVRKEQVELDDSTVTERRTGRLVHVPSTCRRVTAAAVSGNGHRRVGVPPSSHLDGQLGRPPVHHPSFGVVSVGVHVVVGKGIAGAACRRRVNQPGIVVGDPSAVERRRIMVQARPLPISQAHPVSEHRCVT